jgi:ferric-dicitrate binding protein FerR (iron transport regulator)
MERERLIELAEKFVNRQASESEEKELHQWYDETSAVDDEELIVVTENTKTADLVKQNILRKLQAQIEDDEVFSKKTMVIPIWRKPIFKIAVAASLIAAISTVTIVSLQNKKENNTAYTQTKFKNNVAPGSNKAILELADGRKIVLDNVQNGEIANEGNTKIIKLDSGQLAYNTGNSKNAEVSYNTISTPKGGQYHLVLPDGSNVWLNAASTIKLPTVFVGAERKVELTGEAYFEVVKNPSQPFKVSITSPYSATIHSEIEVLGTHFNVNSYSNEHAMKTTLLEGKIKFTIPETGESKMLQPGQQVQLNENNQLKVVNNTDIDEVMAWKNGLFKFKELSIEEVMRQVERWYNVEVAYEGNTQNISEHFVSTISRDVTLIDFLKRLEATGRIHFKIDGKKVTVIP